MKSSLSQRKLRAAGILTRTNSGSRMNTMAKPTAKWYLIGQTDGKDGLALRRDAANGKPVIVPTFFGEYLIRSRLGLAPRRLARMPLITMPIADYNKIRALHALYSNRSCSGDGGQMDPAPMFINVTDNNTPVPFWLSLRLWKLTAWIQDSNKIVAERRKTNK